METKLCLLASLIGLCVSVLDFHQPTTVCGPKPADIMFLLDSSSSIYILDYKKQLNFVNRLIDTFDIGRDKTRVGVSIFSFTYQPSIALTTYDNKENLKRAVNQTRYLTGGTNTHIALSELRRSGFRNARPNVSRIAIVMTDGQSQDFKKTFEEAQRLKATGVIVFAVGIGKDVDMKELTAIGSEPSDQYVLLANDFNDLDTIYDRLAIRACEVQTVEKTTTTLEPTTTIKSTTTKTTTTTEPKTTTEVIPPTTTIEKTTPITKPTTTEKIITTDSSMNDKSSCGRNNMADIMFVFDSMAFGYTKTMHIYKFINEIIRYMSIGSGNIRVGLISEICQNTDISLDQFSDLTKISNYVASYQTFGLAPYIKQLRIASFDPTRGGRMNARRIAILFVEDIFENVQDVLNEAKRAKFQDIEMFVVSIGKTITEGYASTMCSSPVTRHLVHIPSFEVLMSYRPTVLENVCYGL
ncbi:hypothetical protein ACJMK2_043385 [Sinanodonta woodiana]|uniref:VWFA domain-containing protein n=1 Tax=Sinanodonta woodiana TaxID=1069815 RepID=A0ABD3VWQ8_SINWO